MLADSGDLLILVLLGIAAAVGGLIKTYREAKARAEKRSRAHPGQTTEPPPVRRVRKVPRQAEPVIATLEKPQAKVAKHRRGGLREEMAAREEERQTARVVVGVPVKPRLTGISAILASRRTDLEKAILMTEILGRPVSHRDSPVPRFRN